MKNRESKWELLRILSMLAIVSGHLFMHADVARDLSGGALLSACWLGSGSRVAVNVFLMLGVWFMVDARFNARRILSLYAQVLLYSVPLTAFVLLIGHAVPTKEVLRGIFPFWGRGLWFASAYMILLFWAPFLKRVFLLEKRHLQLLLVTLLLFTSLVCTLPDPQMSYALDLYWFACVYLFIGYVKHWTNWCRRVRPLPCIAGGLLIYTALVVVYWWGLESQAAPLARSLGDVAYQWLVDFKTVPNAFAAFLIFIGFAGRPDGVDRWINVCARNTFGVYVLHCVPSFHDFLFRRIVRVQSWIRSPSAFVWAAVSVFGIFVVCSLVDEMRRRFLEPWYMNSRPVAWLCRKLDGFYEGLESS